MDKNILNLNNEKKLFLIVIWIFFTLELIDNKHINKEDI